MNITSKQWFQIVSGVISGLITGAALFNPLFGETLALQIVSVLGISNIVLSSVGTTLSSQSGLVRDVAAMPGVERVSVNASANATLASVALDPSEAKVGAATPDVRAALKEIVKGA